MLSRRLIFVYATSIFLLAMCSAQGQTFRGSISGNVYDSSGAAIPGATVKIVHDATGTTSTLATQSSGDFVFPDLQPGTYTVTVSQPGFGKEQITGVQVEVGKVTSLAVTLKVAGETKTIEVSAAAATLQTEQTDQHA